MRDSVRGLLLFLLLMPLLLLPSPDFAGSASEAYSSNISQEVNPTADLNPLADYPVAQFSADMTSGALPLTVHFTDLSSGIIDYWEWDLNGDGKIDSYEQNPTFIYGKQGVYAVSLYVHGPYGEDRIKKDGYIEAHIGEGQPGTIKWSIDIGGTRSSPAVDEDGVIYVGSYDMSLYAINPDGSIKWSFPTGGMVTASPAVDGDTIYIPSRDGCLYAIYKNGTLKWKALLEEGAFFDGAPAIGPDGSIFVNAHQRQLFAVSPEGEIKWARSSLGSFGNPVTDASGIVYVMENRYYSSPDSGIFFVAYDQNGIELWRTKLASSGGHVMPPAINQRNIFVPSYSGLAALSREGAIEWWAKEEIECDRQTPPCYGRIGNVSSAVVGDGVVYLTSWLGGYIYAVSSEDGIPLWNFNPWISNANIWGTPCVGDDGTVYVLYYTTSDNSSGRLYAINANGTEKWHCTLGMMNANSSSPVIRDGALYVGIDSGQMFYSINVDSSSLAPSHWPCLHGDMKHTGRYDAAAHPPQAGFTVDIKKGEAPLTVAFADDSHGNVESRLWDFGDAATSTDQNPSHTYWNVGSYTVKLTVAGPTGTSTTTKTDYIRVTPISTGSLKVIITPQEAIDAGAKWRLTGETEWRDPGTVTGIPVGAKTVEFKPLQAWSAPAGQDVNITKNSTVTATGAYIQKMGSLTVVISPQGAIDAGAQWTIDGGAHWRESGETVADLEPGLFSLMFNVVPGWTEIKSRMVDVGAGEDKVITAAYIIDISIAATDPDASESKDTGQFTITRSGDISKKLKVPYTVSGTATNGKDYKKLNGAVTVKKNSIGATITVKPKNDKTREDPETVTVTLYNGENATVTIADND